MVQIFKNMIERRVFDQSNIFSWFSHFDSSAHSMYYNLSSMSIKYTHIIFRLKLFKFNWIIFAQSNTYLQCIDRIVSANVDRLLLIFYSSLNLTWWVTSIVVSMCEKYYAGHSMCQPWKTYNSLISTLWTSYSVTKSINRQPMVGIMSSHTPKLTCRAHSSHTRTQTHDQNIGHRH